MIAVLGVDMETGGWHADLLRDEDTGPLDDHSSEREWAQWLAAAVQFQAMRGGGIFIASEPA